MSTENVTRYLCDAPHCPANALSERGEFPEGWRRIGSADHVRREDCATTTLDGRRTPRGKPTWIEATSYSFYLHLCPEHHHAFDGHLPMTVGYPGNPRQHRDAGAHVSCSCGARLGPSGAYFVVLSTAEVDAGVPRGRIQARWWRHLPAELQWYTRRDREAVA